MKKNVQRVSTGAEAVNSVQVENTSNTTPAKWLSAVSTNGVKLITTQSICVITGKRGRLSDIKSQDRKLQITGYMVLRFSGSEIISDLKQCEEDILAAVKRRRQGE